MSSGRSSPVNGGYETVEPTAAMRLTVRKDLFPKQRLPKLGADDTAGPTQLELDEFSCVKLETDFEQSIDEIANQKLLIANGTLPTERSRHRKHKNHSRRDKRSHTVNGGLSSSKRKKRKSSESESRPHRTCSHRIVSTKVKGGKNLNLVSSSECQDNEDVSDEEEEEEESSEDEVLNQCRLKLPIISVPRQSGKPYSHELSQLSTKKSKSKDSKERRTHSHAVTPCSGKPRSMLDICSSRSKKKSKKTESKPTYHSQIVGGTMKIKIKRTSIHEVALKATPPPVSIADLGQRKSKKKRAASPVASESSGEEYVPSKGDTTAIITVAPSKTRHPPAKTNKTNTKTKGKSEKTERSRVNAAQAQYTGPQSPWAQSMPEEILVRIFENVVASQGTLPAVIRLGRVCKLWHIVSCKSELWRNVDLAQYTTEKCRTDYKLHWLLENRLSRCLTLNIANWKVGNIPWVLSCLAEYCPDLKELGVSGWSRLTADQLYDIFQTLPKLQRIDLSHTSETGGSGTCLSAVSVARVMENFGTRLTHLNLAHNKFTALQQILTTIASHCCNLEVLDISGTRATSHPAAVPLEALQRGCPKLRVFRAAYAQLVLAQATTSQQMEVEGWTQLEELSVAGESASERVAVGQYTLGDDALARLVRGATRLKLLDLRGLQKLTDSGLVRVPAWDLQHLFLGGCNVLRQKNACLDLICEKWSHSLIELDMSWASAARVLDDAVTALAESTDSKLRILNLCGSSISLESVKKVLLRCPQLESLNLSSCRALPRGMKRLCVGKELKDLKYSLDPDEAKKAKEDSDSSGKKDEKTDSKTESASESPRNSDVSSGKAAMKAEDKSSSSLFQEPKTPAEAELTKNNSLTKTSPDCISMESVTSKDSNLTSPSETKLLSPVMQTKPDSSSTPRSESSKTDMGSPHFSPVGKPDSQVQNSPELSESLKGNSWSLGQFKSTPTHKSEASPLSRQPDCRLRHGKLTEQCSPTTSHENKLSPDTLPLPHLKQDAIRTPNSWNYGGFSPMPRQDAQFSSQKSPYSTQPSPAQPSPYSAQPSPYSTQPSPYSAQPSPYSSQPSPYSAQPSPDTSQIAKPELQKSSGAWNTGGYSPLTKHPAPYSPHPADPAHPAHPALGKEPRTAPSRTPPQYSPLARQERHHQSPYSPRPSADTKRSPAAAAYQHPPSEPPYGRGGGRAPDASTAWADKFMSRETAESIETLIFGPQGLAGQTMTSRAAGSLHTPPPQPAPHLQPQWSALPSFESGGRRASDDPWSLGQFRVEPPHLPHAGFAEPPSLGFDSLTAHLGHQSHLQSFMDDSFNETSRVD